MRRTLLVRDPPPVVIELHRPSRVELSLVPVETIADPARADRLAAANGVDLVQRRWTRIFAWLGVAVALWIALHLVGCSPADWAAASAAGSTIGAAVDTFALVRARQIEAKSGEATRAAAQGDTLGALRALSEAQAYASAQTLEELAAVRRELAAARAMCPAAAAPKP